MERPDPASIPLAPGVYLYKDAKGKIIYVGKARILRRRVLSYFRQSGLHPKTAAMIARAASIDYIATTTEKEALLLESSLIKKYRPHYNIVLRDDKQYALFKINLKQDFPRLELARKVKKDGAKYFGPYTSALAARETWKLLHRAFSLRRCSDRMMKNRVRPCLYHHMGQCPAPCMGIVKKEEYHKSVGEVCDLLSGRAEPLLERMKNAMEDAALSENFERAAELRDQMRAVEKTVEKQAAILPGSRDMDAIGLYESEKGLALGIIFLRKGAVSGSRSFYWPALGFEDAEEVMSSFLNQFYSQALLPPRILLPWLPSQTALKDQSVVGEEDDSVSGDSEEFLDTKAALEQIFSEKRGSSVRIVAPQNENDERLIDLARANAREEARRRQNQDVDILLENLGQQLNLKGAPKRIECVDVSHISGKQTKVGLVVYENGLPARQEWRLYSMPDSSDDYGTLYAWVERRLEGGEPWPDLLLIDGGKGQLASVARALKDLCKSGLFPLAGIAKARDERGHADRRAGNVSDRIFTEGRANPLPIKPGSQELLFLQQIRDATHNFAIHGHRKARRTAAFSGELMRLPGIGPATARLLWDKFGSLEAMRKASVEELASIKGIGLKKAKSLHERLPKLES